MPSIASRQGRSAAKFLTAPTANRTVMVFLECRASAMFSQAPGHALNEVLASSSMNRLPMQRRAKLEVSESVPLTASTNWAMASGSSWITPRPYSPSEKLPRVIAANLAHSTSSEVLMYWLSSASEVGRGAMCPCRRDPSACLTVLRRLRSAGTVLPLSRRSFLPSGSQEIMDIASTASWDALRVVGLTKVPTRVWTLRGQRLEAKCAM
mmetsp:Transcript_47384/g.74061  ORF Transcript_47384/g.74061 Transcript_47384/m.74061 type:complete len:209 (-) Transcript_47384:1290-1916(-)